MIVPVGGMKVYKTRRYMYIYTQARILARLTSRE